MNWAICLQTRGCVVRMRTKKMALILPMEQLTKGNMNKKKRNNLVVNLYRKKSILKWDIRRLPEEQGERREAAGPPQKSRWRA